MGRGDRWQERTFSNAVNDGKTTQEQWDIAMGNLCPNCKQVWKECKCQEK